MVTSTGAPVNAPIPDDTDPWGLLPQTIREMAEAFNLYDATLKPLTALTRGSDLTIPDSADTLVTYTSEDVDSLGAYPGTGGNLTIPTGMGGLYAVTARAKWNSGGSAVHRDLRIRSNGTVIASNAIPVGTGAAASQQSCCCVTPLAAGDVISVVAWQNSGGNGTVGAGGIGTGVLLARL